MRVWGGGGEGDSCKQTVGVMLCRVGICVNRRRGGCCTVCVVVVAAVVGGGGLNREAGIKACTSCVWGGICVIRGWGDAGRQASMS